MTDKEKINLIRAEIIRRRNKYSKFPDVVSVVKKNVYIGILSFIDSLQEEPVIEDLKEAARKYEENRNDLDARSDNEVVRRAFVAGANWQKQRLSKYAFELKVLEYEGVPTTGGIEVNLPKGIFKAGDKVKLLIIKED